LKKGVVVDNSLHSLALKYCIDTFSKMANKKNFRPKDLQKTSKKSQTANKKNFRPNDLQKNGQKKPNGQPKNRTANQLEIRPNFTNLAAKRPICNPETQLCKLLL